MIRFERAAKRFGGNHAVGGLTLEIGRGEVVALLGPNGSGKTTSLKMAAGLVRPDSGAVLLGDPAQSAHEPAARRVLSFLPQKVGFPDALTGREVVEFYRRLRERPSARADEVLRMAALEGVSRRAVGTYSGGMVQRLGLAVAALAGAPVLLLDEPTASLDPAGLDAFDALVEAQRRDGGTVLFSSHQLADVERLADRVAILARGNLIGLLTQAELSERLADRGVLRARIDACPEGLLDELRRIAPGSRWQGGQLHIPGPARLRVGAIDVVRAAGLEIRSLSAEEGHLDTLYHELIGANP